ncbi:MauE/DoxX family redox-associated membrane protein [Aporhodopirellula aestuarii]|uniref:Methylamine utilisation protein MauE domain-containing protein n=1 Tax=Aporhodopirellula aestuarii TaxID=2950107 RepID=A0ABT0U3Q8_9BACT|nr:MauE/DoxX family redox-associated membrane protein [Aporhodopirellula aestuarii]MCM2371539.1 hypothetical protein [Aporhodopirellula aestuarii]
MNFSTKQLDRHDPMSRYWAASLALLIAASFRLWVPPEWTYTTFYPAVPFFAVPRWLISSVSWALIPLTIGSCGVVFFADRTPLFRRMGWLVIAVALAFGFVADQHRLQPWAYQSFLYACLFCLLSSRLTATAFRVLTISIYFYSSIGKFDFQFLHTVGQDFLSTVTSWIGIDVGQWGQRSRLFAAGVFPVAELTLALLLIVPRTRLIGGVMAIGMHLGLIVILSPWGMGHSPGVICWNAVLAGQAYWLFVYPQRHRSDATSDPRLPENEDICCRSLRVSLASVIVLAAVTLPMTERRGRYDRGDWHWDHWLSWALYSPHNSRVHVEVHRSTLDDLSPGLREFVAEDNEGDSWHELDLGQLSLKARGVPILPQARYQLKLAIAIAEQEGWTHDIRGVLRSASDRWDGTRDERWMNRFDAMQEAAVQF